MEVFREEHFQNKGCSAFALELQAVFHCPFGHDPSGILPL